MRGSVGEKVGEGALSDVHAWAPGLVMKLFKPGVSRELGWHEARMTRAVFAAGLPAPEVHDVVNLDGRFGIVLNRFDGPTLLQLSRSGAMTRAETGAILAALYRQVHQTPPPRDVLTLRVWMGHALRGESGRLVPPLIARAIVALIERLRPAEDGLCHGDLHPDNVIMTAEGPRLIDWSSAIRVPAAYDLARCHIVLTELAPETVDDPGRPRAVKAATFAEYARLADTTPAALSAAMEPWLPFAHAFVLLSGATGTLRERMIQRLEAAL
ncbi:MAG: aminoglycoside phosphotransferase family protein [Alphaproteobacteria bacterium]|nr:aminoglycoside phosphotransferase family protein [Alphaproteobacteria bacterium]